VSIAGACWCGRREKGRALPLQWSDLDFSTGTLPFPGRWRDPSGFTDQGHKEWEKHAVSWCPACTECAGEHRLEQGRDRAQFGPSYQDKDFIFCRPEGGYCSPDRMTDRVTALAKKLVFQTYNLARMRHSHTSQLLCEGAPIPVVVKRLGHASPTSP
jgi:integrase